MTNPLPGILLIIIILFVLIGILIRKYSLYPSFLLPKSSNITVLEKDNNKANTDIEFLISAFSYSFASMNETFYLRKRDLKVIGVHMFDYSLVSECKSEYNSGLDKDEERDIKEAIIANEKNYDTHIFIPRLSKDERIEIMQEFIKSKSDNKKVMESNLKDLIKSAEEYNSEFYKKGIKAGIEMEYLTNGVKSKNVKSEWRNFYRDKVKIIALKWLDQQKNVLQHQV